jgi:hypothetical protein
MSLGWILLYVVGVILILAIGLSEWVKYERNKIEGSLKNRRIFRRRG